MSDDSSKADNLEVTPENVFSAVGGVSSQLQTIEKFIARRFDELSMEINATSQQVDMAEEGIIGRFGEIANVLQAISFSGDGNTPANAGVELGAVVDMTEEATNKILDATNHIKEQLESDIDWSDEGKRQAFLDVIESKTDEIFMACSFQDVTGQRIRKTLDNLKEIEDRLNGAMGKMGIEVETEGDPMGGAEYAKNQDDIDALFDD